MLRRLLNSESKHRILIEKRIIRDKIKDQGSSDSNIVIPTAKDDVLENITNLVIKTINNIVIPTAKDNNIGFDILRYTCMDAPLIGVYSYEFYKPTPRWNV